MLVYCCSEELTFAQHINTRPERDSITQRKDSLTQRKDSIIETIVSAYDRKDHNMKIPNISGYTITLRLPLGSLACALVVRLSGCLMVICLVYVLKILVVL